MAGHVINVEPDSAPALLQQSPRRWLRADPVEGDRLRIRPADRVIAERPELATSQDRIRVALGIQRDVVYASLARLIERGWITPPERQRQPYAVTPQGRVELSQAAHSMSRPESSRVVPSSRPEQLSRPRPLRAGRLTDCESTESAPRGWLPWRACVVCGERFRRLLAVFPDVRRAADRQAHGR